MSRLNESIEILNGTIISVQDDLSGFKTILERMEGTLALLSSKVEVVESGSASITELHNTDADKVQLLATSLAILEERVSKLETKHNETFKVTFDFHKANVNFTEANAYCKSNGGFLAELYTQERITAAFNLDMGKFVWFGLRRSTEDGLFRWIKQGSEAVDLKWKEGYPKDYHDCALIAKEQWPAFKSASCSNEKNFLCEHS